MDRIEVQNLLSEYVLGQLDPTQAAAMAEHLEQDEELHKMEQFLRWVRPLLLEMNDHLPGNHATGEELVCAAIGQGEFPNHREDWVRDHLAGCTDCRQLVETIKKADGQLGDEAHQRHPQSRQWTKMAAAACIALILLTSGIWIGTRHDGAPSRLDATAIHLAGLSRSQTGTVDVSTAADGQLPPLVLECDPWVGRASAEDFLLEIRLLERDTHQVVQRWERSAVKGWSVVDQGIRLENTADSLAAGDYDLEIRDDRGQVIFQTRFHLLPR